MQVAAADGWMLFTEGERGERSKARPPTGLGSWLGSLASLGSTGPPRAAYAQIVHILSLFSVVGK